MSSLERRRFLTVLGAGALAGGLGVPRLLANVPGGDLVESEAEYGGFLVERLSADSTPHDYDPAVLKRMSEKLNIFSRNRWDPVRQDRPELQEDLFQLRFVEGRGVLPDQTRLDHALQAGAWATASMGGGPAYAWGVQTGQAKTMVSLGPWDPADLDLTWDDVRRIVKHAALFYGASLAGVTRLNPLWIYADHYAPTPENPERVIPVIVGGDRFEQTDDAWFIPSAMDRAVVLAFEEDFHAIANSPGSLSSAATGNGYSRMANTALFLAEFIRALGYRALPAGNGVGLSVPMAIDAGLGQQGRMGLLVTPKFGPRVRLAKVLTDMPLATDSPIDFGVTEFCERCQLCATHCPSGAVTSGPRALAGASPSNNPGARKWYAEVEYCYDYNGFGCSTCKRVCPFNKPNNSWLHRAARALLLGKVGVVGGALASADQAMGYGRQAADHEFWQLDGTKCITARDPAS